VSQPPHCCVPTRSRHVTGLVLPDII